MPSQSMTPSPSALAARQAVTWGPTTGGRSTCVAGTLIDAWCADSSAPPITSVKDPFPSSPVVDVPSLVVIEPWLPPSVVVVVLAATIVVVVPAPSVVVVLAPSVVVVVPTPSVVVV